MVDPAVIDLTLQTVKPLLKCCLNRLKANKALLKMNRTILNLSLIPMILTTLLLLTATPLSAPRA